MKLLARLNRPWIHFIVLGCLLYYLQGVLFPEPKPVIGPLSPARIEALQQQWLAATGRLPTGEQLERMVGAELDRDMLFQRALELKLHLYDTVVYQRLLRNMSFLQLGEGMSEQEQYQQALDMRLHLGDEVIKRRMIQVMEQLLLGFNPPAAPTEEALQAEFESRREELRLPPRYSIEHVYFNADREAEAAAAVAAISEQQLDPEAALEFSSPFLPGYRFARQSPDQLARHFGSAFVANLEEASPVPGTWVGPLRSTYGLHYVWVEAIEPGRDATLEEVRPRLLRDIEARNTAAALQQSIDAMRADYEVKK
ncbi:MAG: peptidyl-prolyl cis-trans isomerase [Halieaceae bacterium]|nr:peptidyl-prolyl cis-trans isomerase [Halieaceae bacterium]MCP5163845.1 peptidyl-prolyl cis-trans isomerase [Pseudomonadales bacterium]MCP5202895.1 peptidyl-prolyl cis-trans isomerase [Pseudomonadales bacterium]